MITELTDILQNDLGVEAERIRAIQALDVAGDESLVARIKAEGLLEEETLLRAFAALLSLRVLDRIQIGRAHV